MLGSPNLPEDDYMRDCSCNNTEKPPLNPHAGQHATQNRDSDQRKEQPSDKATRRRSEDLHSYMMVVLFHRLEVHGFPMQVLFHLD